MVTDVVNVERRLPIRFRSLRRNWYVVKQLIATTSEINDAKIAIHTWNDNSVTSNDNT